MIKFGARNFWFLLAVASYLSLSMIATGASAEGIGQSVKGASLRYLSHLDQGAKILVWPSYTRTYELINAGPEIDGSVSEYRTNRDGIFDLVRTSGTTQISIISVSPGVFANDIEKLLGNSKLLQGYKSFAYTARLSGDGCTAYKFTSRKTWISVGLVFVDKTKFGIGNKVETNACVFGALDYVNGFPTKDTYFEYMSLPQEPVRKLILEAIHRCAADGDNRSRQDEITKDGITPLPSLGCVAAKIGQ
ncbi:hypothetical protein [Mesorhizobium sp. M0870]|uniref:hypothetical protein n=1 Tax=Mesorhizobium sp. M0870 TaxID=2957016 RepID=UPI003335F164